MAVKARTQAVYAQAGQKILYLLDKLTQTIRLLPPLPKQGHSPERSSK